MKKLCAYIISVTLIFLSTTVAHAFVWESIIIRPEERGLVLDAKGDVVRELGPGLNQYNRLIRTVIVEDVLSEREYSSDINTPFRDCAFRVRVYWNIGDLSTYHKAGADLRLDATVSAILAGAMPGLNALPTSSDKKPNEQIWTHFHSAFREDETLAAIGVKYQRSNVRCE